ncbi:acyltransferase family protein [Agromyces sp. MMS24-K17]|uniref:acyltransferase family protein n=1 Tax=Agromyces sp. MMS24-K17 TaxID=3372850 RepID=UPI003754BD1A
MPETAIPSPRLAWADLARGGAMILVVYAHAVQLLDAYGWRLGLFDTANVYLTAVRMPLFFLISGTFAVRAVRRSWPQLFASRLALLIYMYLLWMLVRAIWFSFVPWPLADLSPWVALLVAPVWPTNGLWFLFALIAYLVLAKATVRLPVWVTLAAFAVVSVLAASDLVPTGGNWTWKSIAMYGFFFVLGVHGSKLWQGIAERSKLAWAPLALFAIPGGMALFTLFPDALQGVARIALSTVCVAACVVVASIVSRWRAFARPFVFVGRRTIAIYVVHAMLLAAVVPLIPEGSVPAALVIALLTAFGVVVPLVLYRWLGPVGGVFNLPHPAKRALDRWAGRRDPQPAAEEA